LAIGHRLAGLTVPCVDEQRDDVVTAHVLAAPAIDVGHDALAQLPELVGEGQVARGVVGEQREGVVAGRRAESMEIVAEQRAQNDIERDFAHVLRHVDRRAAARGGRPLVRKPFVRRMDVRHPRRDYRAVERRLDQPALRSPLITLTGHQAVAQEDGDPLDSDALGEIGVMVDEHMADMVRMRQHPDVAFQCGRKGAIGIAMLLEQAHERRERIGLERDVERLHRAWRWRCRGRLRVHLFVIGGYFPAMIDAFAKSSEKEHVVVAMPTPKDYNFIPSLLRNNPTKLSARQRGAAALMWASGKQHCSLTICNR
jgi:hypothetical protein